MKKRQFLTAKEAAEELSISISTLYAYVSRGLLRSEETEGKSRAKRYLKADIDALKTKQSYRNNPDKVGQKSLHNGVPVLDSKITLIENGQLYYRGYDALKLAQTRKFEEVAALLWSDSFSTTPFFSAENYLLLELPFLADGLTPIERYQTFLPLAASQDLAAYDPSPLGNQKTGARIMRLLTTLTTGKRRFDSIAEALQTTWIPDRPDLIPILDAALILCADHELNVSAFTARCVASAGSTLYQVMQGGLAALHGYKHGGYTDRVAALMDQIGSDPALVESRLNGLIRRQEPLHGFNHPLYPTGDPRCRMLLELAQRHGEEKNVVKISGKMARIIAENLNRYPTLDFGLIVLARALNLPAEAPITLFAIGRSSGWIAHALEQYASNRLIRPRAKYVGSPIREEVD